MNPLPAWAPWFADKDFTEDWLTANLGPWVEVLGAFKDRPVRVLDIGSFEGRSCIAFLELLPHSEVTAIDFFRDEVDGRFDRNIADYGGRVRKLKGRALTHLDNLFRKRERFDVVYLDAGKKRDAVFALTAAAWPLLSVGGVMIWDDVLWRQEKPDEERPESAVRLFCAAFAEVLQMRWDGYQIIVTKTAEWPAPLRRARWPRLLRKLGFR